MYCVYTVANNRGKNYMGFVRNCCLFDIWKMHTTSIFIHCKRQIWSVCCLRMDRPNYWIGWQFFIVNLNLFLYQCFSSNFANIERCFFTLRWNAMRTILQNPYTLVSLKAITFHFHSVSDFLSFQMITSNVNIFMAMLCIWMMIDMLLEMWFQPHWQTIEQI